jgi:hypothetical protein
MEAEELEADKLSDIEDFKSELSDGEDSNYD